MYILLIMIIYTFILGPIEKISKTYQYALESMRLVRRTRLHVNFSAALRKSIF